MASRTTVVLGGGWKLGGAFHAGVLLALHDSWDLDVRRVDALIGTSSGAVVSGLVGAGLSPQDLFRRETGQELSDEGRQRLERARSAARRVADDDTDPTTVHRPTHTPEFSTRALLTAMLPRGTQPMSRVEHFFDHLIGPRWPTGIDLQFCAVDRGTGQRVALDRRSGATIGQAVAASCSVPGLSQPVPINDREYIDGAVYSINNADLASTRENTPTDGSDVHTVIVSAPLSINRLQPRIGPMWALRNALHLQTAAEVRRLQRVDRIVVIEPNHDLVTTMGPNLNANGRRAKVADDAYRRASRRLTSLGAPPPDALPLMTR